MYNARCRPGHGMGPIQLHAINGCLRLGCSTLLQGLRCRGS